jgi:predicted ribonuclease YlaK
MTYLFVDTNVLLHYRRLEEIDWLNLSKSKEAVIVLCLAVVRELDEHKISHHQGKIRKRAQEIIASLHRKLSGEESDVIRDGVQLEFVAEEPSIDFSEHRLRSEIADDWLIASVIELKQKHPTDEIKIVSADLGLSIKAKAQSINVLRPSEADKLADELDEGEKRIKDLQRELAEIKNSLPELKLCFWKSEKQNIFQVQLQQPIPFPEDEANTEMSRIRVKHPYFSIPSKPKKIGEGISIGIVHFTNNNAGFWRRSGLNPPFRRISGSPFSRSPVWNFSLWASNPVAASRSSPGAMPHAAARSIATAARA